MKVKLLISMAGPDVSHNAGDEINVGDSTAKRFIERNVAEGFRQYLQKKRLRRKPRASVRL